MKKIKIVHFITGNEGGGAEKMLEKIVAFSPKNQKHHIILLKQSNNLNVKNLYKLNFSKNPLNFLIEFFKLVKLFKELKPDIAMSWLYHSDLIIFILSKFLKFPNDRIIWNVRCSYLDLKDYSIITKYTLFLLTKFSKNIGNIIFNSHEGKRYHKVLGYRNRNMSVIPNGFDLKKLKIDYSKKQFLKKKYNISKEKLVGMIARNDPTKDFDLFIKIPDKAFLKKQLNVIYLIAGKNTEKIIIPDESKKFFLNLGYQKNIYQYLNILDVIVLISKGEGFPNIIGEAMSMNIPVVCNDVGDNKKIIRNSGIILPKKTSAEEIRNSLNKIFKNKNKYTNGRMIIKKHYQISKISNEYSNLFNSIMFKKNN